VLCRRKNAARVRYLFEFIPVLDGIAQSSSPTSLLGLLAGRQSSTRTDDKIQ
jgi:hypothetical protein